MPVVRSAHKQPAGSRSLLRTATATHFVAPLREGGSLPAIVEADDLGTYVLKFRGAGQGRKVLVTELVAGEIACHLGLKCRRSYSRGSTQLGRTEPDPEIQDLIRASGSLNLALHYLPSSLGFNPIVNPPGPDFAAYILWFDALVQKLTAPYATRNVLVWHGRL